jgi:CDP-6-deoxy-D-xylo-4-hexulose-3-dehydrase
MTDSFVPRTSYIPVSGKVHDQEEVNLAIEVAKDCWWTEGRFSAQFEKEFSELYGGKLVSLANSGSSANLLALASLTSLAFKEKRLKRGDEFITTAVAFPTTVNPGILYGLKPVFIDVDLDTLNIDVNEIEKNISNKTKLIMVAHTLGIPFDIEKVMYLKNKYNLLVIEDCCDALGSTVNGKLVGTFGDVATFSFYPAHHITMGEGGAVITSNPAIHKSIRQLRDWGRDCWCGTGKDNTCKKRFSWKLGELPFGYDHKYIYSQIGYNLKLTDFQAAIGLAQLKKLTGFIKKRKENYKSLNQVFGKYRQYFNIPKPNPNSDPSWFGFPVIISLEAPFNRNELTQYFEEYKVGTRNIFSGNLLRHPAYIPLRKSFRIIGEMKNADTVMNQAFWIGLYPGIGEDEIKYIAKVLDSFIAKYAQSNTNKISKTL